MDCSIIIPNFNGRHVLGTCLAALYEQTSTRLIEREIIVVDNGSTDDSRQFVTAEYPEVSVISLPRNTGFTGGIAAGVEAARGDTLVFLNNDTRPDFVWLESLLQPLRDPAVAAVGSLMLNASEEAIDFAGGTANLFGWGFQQGHGTPAPVAEPEAAPVPMLFVCGGAMAVRRPVYQQVGGFDGEYFAFFEDVDLGWRLNLAGHRVVLAPASRVAHQQSHTAKQMPKSLRTFLIERNAFTTMVKNLSEANLHRLLPWATALLLERSLLDLGIERDRLFAGRWGDEIFSRGSRSAAESLAEGMSRIEESSKRLVKESLLGEGNQTERGQGRLLALQAVFRRWPYWLSRRAEIQGLRQVGDRQLFPLMKDLLRPPLGHPREQELLDQLAALLRSGE
ncbi:MAG: hypothetical protein GEEBNDBF_01116 [bacterium]|nr:hypothetical protein [bacterium]